jgi:hypothetical protein
MSGERFDYTSERQRHEKFVGREALLARLDALTLDELGGWVPADTAFLRVRHIATRESPDLVRNLQLQRPRRDRP